MIAGPLRLAGLDVRCGDVRDRSTAEAVLGRPEVIVNCAVDSGWATTAPETNRRLLRAVGEIEGTRKLIQFSSVGVYGTCIDRRRAFADRPRAHARYAREKLDQERSAIRYEPLGRGTVILRMGHVYGPYQWLSRSIFEFLEARGPRLPFDGRNASNAIHIENVCRAVGWLVQGGPPNGIWDLLDRPQHTWRELVDWHAAAIGAATLAGMDEERSRVLAARYRTMESTPLAVQLALEFGRALASFPSTFAVSSSTAVAIGQRVLSALGSARLEGNLRARHALVRARLGVAAEAEVTPPPWLLSDESPGRLLEYPSASLSPDDQRDVASWYRGYAVPPPVDDVEGG